MTVGIFFHPLFSRESWPVIGNKFKNFPQVMEDELGLPGVKLFEPRPVSEELLLKVCTKELANQTKRAWYGKEASLSVGSGAMQPKKMPWEPYDHLPRWFPGR